MKEEKINNILSSIKFDNKGLIPAIAQDFSNKEVLMMAYMNKESLKKTLESKIMHYYSRSKNKIWKKGEQSGQIQYVQEIALDCDKDAILASVLVKGKKISDKLIKVACHTGRKNCFFNKIDDEANIKINQKILINPSELYE